MDRGKLCASWIDTVIGTIRVYASAHNDSNAELCCGTVVTDVLKIGSDYAAVVAQLLFVACPLQLSLRAI